MSDTGSARSHTLSKSATSAATSAGERTTNEPDDGRSPRIGSSAAARSKITSFTGIHDVSRSLPPCPAPRRAVRSETASVKPSVSYTDRIRTSGEISTAPADAGVPVTYGGFARCSTSDEHSASSWR